LCEERLSNAEGREKYLRIGLLEDDLAIQEMLRLLLQSEGYEVIVYPGAQACLDDLRKPGMEAPRPDLLLLDLRLANSASGLAVIEQIRLTPHLESLPIILMTASATLDRRELERRRAVLLRKPFDVNDVVRLIHELTGQAEEGTS
jgi:two-component system chemotaxis response regulator CheY